MMLIALSLSFYWTRRFITEFTNTYQLFITLVRSNQSLPSQSTFWGFILILLSHLPLGLPSGFHTKILYTPLLYFYIPRTSHSSWFGHSYDIWWRAQITKLIFMWSPPFHCHFVPLRSKCLFSNLFSKTLCLYFFLNVGDHTSYCHQNFTCRNLSLKTKLWN